MDCCGNSHGNGNRNNECCCGSGWRRYLTPEEEKAKLEDYLGELEKEIEGVKARIAKI
jgi:hypothetical protein